MSQQIGFFITDQDRKSILDFAESLNFNAIPERTDSDPEENILEAVDPTKFVIPKGQYDIYLLPGHFSVVEAFYRELPEFSCWKLMDDVSPVIQFRPSTQKDDHLTNGRLYFNMETDDPRYSYALQEYRKLAKFIQNWSKTDRFNFYVGPIAKELSQRGDIQLKHFSHKLKVLERAK